MLPILLEYQMLISLYLYIDGLSGTNFAMDIKIWYPNDDVKEFTILAILIADLMKSTEQPRNKFLTPELITQWLLVWNIN